MILRSRVRAVLGCTLPLVLGAGCGMETVPSQDHVQGQHDQAIVDVSHTPVERQTIGNCWVYAGAAWAESLHHRASGSTLDVSESYWTYMHWFRQLTSSPNQEIKEISTGGHWAEFQQIVLAYGLVSERDFIAADSNDERAFSQSRALAAMNAELSAGGRLASPADRADLAKVRQVLDEAWQLTDRVRGELSAAFGVDLARTLPRGATTKDTPFLAAAEVAVAYGSRPRLTLADALREWREVGYSRYGARSALRRVQRALHAREPVVISWFVDFNALESNRSNPRYGSFNLETLENSGTPGNQGRHMTVLEDYQARLHREFATTLVEVTHATQVPQGTFEAIAVEDAPSIRIEAGQTLSVSMSGDGDGDLYVQTATPPTKQSYLCRPYTSGSSESCAVAGPADVFVAVDGYRAARVQLTFTTQLITEQEHTLAAGVTLDPANPDDAAQLAAALDDSTEIEFLRTKNSWGANRQGLAMVPGFDKGYHDLYLDYLDGPVAEASACKDGFASATCARKTTPLGSFILPPGY